MYLRDCHLPTTMELWQLAVWHTESVSTAYGDLCEELSRASGRLGAHLGGCMGWLALSSIPLFPPLQHAKESPQVGVAGGAGL